MAQSSKTVTMLAGVVDGRVEPANDDVTVTDVSHDSREVTPGSLYVAVRGAHVDGHVFIPMAVKAGAVAVCVDHYVDSGVPELVVDDTRRVIGELSAAVHDYPSRALKVVGVTGTNGKTTVTHHVEAIAASAGVSAGVVGTIHTRAAGSTLPATLTTPEAPDFQRLLAGMRDDGVALVATEVSSHALEFGRVGGTRFEVAVFTNLSQDHLDFHGDMGAYRDAKRRLFTDYELGTAVVNVDDPTGAEIAADFQGALIKVGKGGDFAVDSIDTFASHSKFTLNSPAGEITITAPVIGEFNVWNLVLAAAACVAAGLDYEEVFGAMSRVPGVPGRFELVSDDDPITVIVDYAHTPEGVARAVATGRQLSRGRVIALIGAGGDRDRAKRPAMGAAVSAADFAVITSDNPRSEDPAEIAATVVSGVAAGSDHLVVIDRRKAIDTAIDAADDGDVVLLLGRGHEPEQDLGSQKVPFDDRAVAASSLARRRSAENDSASGSMKQ